MKKALLAVVVSGLLLAAAPSQDAANEATDCNSRSFVTIDILAPQLQPGEDYAIVGPSFVAVAQVTPGSILVGARLEADGVTAYQGTCLSLAGAKLYEYGFEGVEPGWYTLQVYEIGSDTPVIASRYVWVGE